MIDIHAHFAEEGYTFEEEWERILAAGVTRVVLAGDNVRHSRMHAEFAAAHEGAFFTAGIHPSEAETASEEALQQLAALARQPKCVAIGEIGLDYHYEGFDKRVQQRVFAAQLQLAHALGIPVQIHSRDCAADMLAMLREHAALLTKGFLLHCYAHGREMMDDFLALGAYFSFGGTVCFKNARRVTESVVCCPSERLLTETDSPYLSPFRGQKNTPANIPVILARIAELRGEQPALLQACIRENAVRLFPDLQ